MSEIQSIFLTASLTIVGGLFLLLVGEILSKFFIEPIHEQSKLRGEVADCLIYYADVYSNPGIGSKESMAEASEELRRVASRLRARTEAVPKYGLWEVLGLVPKYENVVDASANLIGLSNAVHEGDPEFNDRSRKTIEEKLNIRTRP